VFGRREGVTGIGLIGIALGIGGVLYDRWLDSLHDCAGKSARAIRAFSLLHFFWNVFIAFWVAW
jgi:hypothetical protein